MTTLHLIDAVERHRESPLTFEVPSEKELAAIKVGDFVRIGATFDITHRIAGIVDPPIRLLWEAKIGPQAARNTDAERFWVEVVAVSPTTLRGVVNNDLVYTAHHGLTCDAEVTFERRNILSIFLEKNHG